MLPRRVKTDKRHEKAFNFTCSSPLLCITWRCHQNVNQNLLTSCNAESVMRKFSKPDSTLQNHKQGHIILCVLECKSEMYTFHFNLVYICWIFLLVVFIYYLFSPFGAMQVWVWLILITHQYNDKYNFSFIYPFIWAQFDFSFKFRL